jgi:hypothetical protein
MHEKWRHLPLLLGVAVGSVVMIISPQVSAPNGPQLDTLVLCFVGGYLAVRILSGAFLSSPEEKE